MNIYWTKKLEMASPLFFARRMKIRFKGRKQNGSHEKSNDR